MTYRSDDDALDDEGTELLRERFYLGVEEAAAASLVAVGLIIVFLWTEASRTGLVVWTIAMTLVIPIPSLMKRWHPPLDRWFRLVWKCELLLGLTWGSVALLAMPASPAWQAALGSVLAAILVGSSVSSSQFVLPFWCFNTPLIGLTIAGFAIDGVGAGRFTILIMAVAGAFGASLAHEQRTLQVDLVRTLRENRRLVEDLADRHEKLTIANKNLAAASAKADRMARTDSLTGLANRLAFDELLEDQLDALRLGQRRHLTLAYLDVDNFKYVNDNRGHRAGDLLLVMVARRLGEATRDGEVVARLGGDELVVVSKSFDPFEVGKRLRSIFDEPFVIDDRELFVSSSIGVVTVVDDITSDELLRRADAAQYDAKNAGGNRFVVHAASASSGPSAWD